MINSSLGSLSRMGGAWQGEATYPLRGYGRGPGKAGVLLGEEEFERGAYDTGETFLPSTGPQHRREEEEACGQGVPAAIRGEVGWLQHHLAYILVQYLSDNLCQYLARRL